MPAATSWSPSTGSAPASRIGSAALIAEGQHARADGFTSIAVVVGVIGVWLGFEQADAIIGFFIAAAILWILVNSCGPPAAA